MSCGQTDMWLDMQYSPPILSVLSLHMPHFIYKVSSDLPVLCIEG